MAATVARRVLERLWWRGQPMFLYCPAFISFLIVHSHEHMIPSLDSDAICSNRAFMDRASWIIPKLTLDCHLIATTLASHPYRKVAIILDFWIFFVFLSSIIIVVATIRMNIQVYKNHWEAPYQMYSYPRRCLIAIIAVITFIIAIWWTLFGSVFTFHPDILYSEIVGTLSGYGFGAAFHTFVVGLPVCLFGIVRSTICRKKPDTGGIDGK